MEENDLSPKFWNKGLVDVDWKVERCYINRVYDVITIDYFLCCCTCNEGNNGRRNILVVLNACRLPKSNTCKA